MKQQLYYLQRKPGGCVDNPVSTVWCASSGGYTIYLEKAERMPESDALGFVNKNPEKWAAYPCDIIDKLAHRIFYKQDFKHVRAKMEDK